jgi:hypothetical protein
MSRFVNKTKVFLILLSKGLFLDILKIIKYRMYSNTYYYFLKRDLHLGLQTEIPKAKIDISLRLYEESDAKYFKNLPWDDMLLEANIPTCYVAVTKDNKPCFRQWLIEPSQNNKVKGFFGDNFPVLEEDECIFERAYAPKNYRGLNIMPAVNYLLGKKALELGYRWTVACIETTNTKSLKAVHKLDTRPYKLQVTKWRLFKRVTVYKDIPQKLKDKNPWLFDK